MTTYRKHRIIHFQLPWVILVLVLIISSCSKQLEENPDNRVEPTTAEDYYAIITGAYPGAWYLFTEIMSDNYRFYNYEGFNISTIESWFKPMYLWSDNYDLNLPIGPEFAWDSYYHSIYKSNVVLEGVDDADGDLEVLRHIKGEALLVRAYSHFILVNLFANNYNATTASSDLGIPYAFETEKEGIVPHKRETVEFVYKQIEKDALEGINLINNRHIKMTKFHFTKEAAFAFLTRFYLFTGDWEKCIQYSDSCLQRNSSVRDFIGDYNTFFATSDFDGYSNDYFSSEKQNILLMNKVLEWNSFWGTGFYANEFADQFRPGDFRGNIFVHNDQINLNRHTLKFIGQYDDGQQYSNAAHFSVEEVLLNRAEAYVRKQNPDVNKALNDINEILQYRYTTFSPLSTNSFASSPYPLEIAVLERIINERRYEFCYEGYRWFDLKRFQIPIAHSTEFGTIYLEGDDPKYILQIPEKELSANKSMIPNPR